MNFDYKTVGDLVRARRKELRLRQEDLSDDNISPTTISNIENGVASVNPEKVNYLLNKLGIPLDQLDHLIEAEQKKLEKIKIRLEAIENIIDSQAANKGLDRLKSLNIGNSHPLLARVEYLKGKCFYRKGNYDKANVHFWEAIRLSEQNEDDQSNIKAASFNELSLIAFFQKDILQALSFVEEGIKSFIDDGERKYALFTLKKNRAGFLKELGRYEESDWQVNELWKHYDELKPDLKIQLHEFKTHSLKRSKQYDQAVQCARQGIELARQNNLIHLTFDLWTLLGDIHVEIGDFETAEYTYKACADLNTPYDNEYWLTSTYTQLGKLYILQRKYDLAEKALNEAVQMCESCHDKTRVIKAYETQGDLYLKQDMFDKALQPYEKALHLARSYQLKEQEVKILQKRAECLEHLDESEFHQCLLDKFRVEKGLKGRD